MQYLRHSGKELLKHICNGFHKLIIYPNTREKVQRNITFSLRKQHSLHYTGGYHTST